GVWHRTSVLKPHAVGRYSVPLLAGRLESCKRIVCLLADDPRVVLGHHALDRDRQEAGTGPGLDLSAPHEMHADAGLRGGFHPIQERGHVTRRTVEVVGDDAACLVRAYGGIQGTKPAPLTS